MQHYDFIIAGGGAAGVSLAYQMILSPLRNRTILIIDKDDDDQLQRNWGFWTAQPTLYDKVVHHAWRQIEFVTASYKRRFDLGPYEYRLMHGGDFYRYVLEQLAACPNVTFTRGVVGSIVDQAGSAQVSVNDDIVEGDWVFDSIVKPAELKRELAGHHFLRMQFKGLEVETPCLAFDPTATRLFDFRTPQSGMLRFMYLMPYTTNHAFIEYTVFSAQVLKQQEFDAALQYYIETVLGIKTYRVLSREAGAVPITDQPLSRRKGRHVMSIGTKGGRIKPSTGYSFMRIQKDAAATVESLLRVGHPFDVPADRRFYRLCDSLLLDIINAHGESIEPIFTALFRRNPIQRVLRFLDEASSPLETAALIASLPRARFLQAVLRMAMQPSGNAVE